MIVSKYSFRIGKTHKNSCWRIAIHDAILFLVCIISLRFPFDWKNPLGYLVAFILICIINLNIVIFMMCNLCLGIEVYALITSFTKDIKYELSAFSRMARSELNLSKRLFGIVHFHSTVKRFDKSNFDYIPLTQFSFDFFLFFLSHFFQRRVCSVAKIVEPILTVFYIGNILAMCIPMISIQWAMVRMNIVLMLSCVTCGHNSFNISIFSITRKWQ